MFNKFMYKVFIVSEMETMDEFNKTVFLSPNLTWHPPPPSTQHGSKLITLDPFSHGGYSNLPFYKYKLILDRNFSIPVCSTSANTIISELKNTLFIQVTRHSLLHIWGTLNKKPIVQQRRCSNGLLSAESLVLLYALLLDMAAIKQQ